MVGLLDFSQIDLHQGRTRAHSYGLVEEMQIVELKDYPGGIDIDRHLETIDSYIP
jgi:hypothetical protein